MAGDLVLITGGSGHVGFSVLRHALDSGYQVRAAVRSQAKADKIKSHAAIKATIKDGQLSFIIIPDFTVPNAFDEAAAGVKYIIHVASPLASRPPADGDYKRGFVEPAVNMTLNMLEAAKRAGTVKRIVVTSSVVAVTGIEPMVMETGLTYSAESRVAELTEYDNPFTGYIASKIAALHRAEAWVKEHQPPFDVIHIHPTWVEGPYDLCDNTNDFLTSTNVFIANIAAGLPPPFPAITNNWNHIADCARIHVEALEPHVKGNQSYIVSTDGQDGMRWEDVREIVQKRFGKEVSSGVLANNGTLGSLTMKLDVAKTVQTFGPLKMTFEDAVVGAVGQYLELQARPVEVEA